MTPNQPLIKLRKFLQRLGLMNIWALLALLQILILSILWLTWPPASRVRLTLVIPSSELASWSSLIADFESKNKDIQIQLIEVENHQGDLTEKLKDFYSINFGADNPYDLIYMDVIWVAEFANKGWLMNLSDRILPKELTNFLESDVTAGRYQGGLYRIPYRSDIGLLYYRKDLLEQAGYDRPHTFQELQQISQLLQQQGKTKWGYLWQGREYEGLAAMFVEVLHGYGGFWINPTTLEVGLGQDEAIGAVKFLISTIDEKISPPEVLSYSEDESLAEFQQGNAVFLRNWSFVWAKVNAKDSPIRGKVGILPMIRHTKSHSSGSCNGSWGLGIAKTSKHPNEAWKVIRYLTSPQIQRQFILKTGYIPSYQLMFRDPEIVNKYPHFHKLANAVETSILRPPIPQYAQASEILQRYLSAALTKRLSPEQAMTAAADATRKLLEK